MMGQAYGVFGLILTLYTLRHTIVLAIFEKFPRSRLFSDMRQISASDRTAHVVHCKKKTIVEIF